MNRSTTSRRSWLAGTALIGLALAGCAGGGGNVAADKVAGDPSHLTLVLADSQPVGAPSNLAAMAFADAVQHRSDGAITVSVLADASDDPTDDAPIISGLRDGRFDLAVVPTRAWGASGVQSIDALQAPYEITSLEHMAAVAADDDLAAELMVGLDEIGVHGLGLLPEGLRFLFSYGTAVLTPDDLNGATVWSITPGAERLLAPLGTQVVGPTDGEPQEMAAVGRVDAVESDFWRAATNDQLFSTTATGDLPVFAKFVSIVANAERWRGFTASERAVMIEAAADARDAVIAAMAPLREQTDLFCSREGAVVKAGQAALEAFRTAVAPVVADFDQVKLAAIRTLAPVSSPGEVTPCDGRPITQPHSPTGSAAFPDGVYRLEWDAEFAASWNAAHDASTAILFREAELDDLPAVVTWTMTNGRYDFSIEFRNRKPFFTSGGTYRVDGNMLWLTCLAEMCAGTNTIQWSADDDGTLTMRQDDGRPLDPYYAVPWIRVGDAPPSS